MAVITITSLTNDGLGTATANTAPTAHGFSSGDHITVVGADQSEYNISAVIFNVTGTSWDYTISGTPASPATGVISAFPVASAPAVSSPIQIGVGGSEPSLAEPLQLGKAQGYYAISEVVETGVGSGGVGMSDLFNAYSVDFVADITSGNAPLGVQFTHVNDLSFPFDTFLWEFGNGDTSTDPNPSYTYPSAGTFTVKLTATAHDPDLPGGEGTAVKEKVAYIQVLAEPVADFSATPTSGTTPLTVQFNNESTFVATSYIWDFGDGSIGTGVTPEHIYETPGSYTVTLTATHPSLGPLSETKVNFIVATAPVPVPLFSAVPVTGFEPLEVTFTNESTGFPDEFLWDFGDGTTSTEENPVHIYDTAGVFDVTLTASNGTGSATSAPVTIDVQPVPDLVADFITGSMTQTSSILVEFVDKSQEALTWTWDFGDPASGVLNTSYEQNPEHLYPSPGVYQVTLTVTHGPFTTTICKNVLVTTDALRYMEIWGTAQFTDGTPVAPDRVVTVGREITPTETECESGATDTFHEYKTIDDGGVTRYLVRGRGHVIGIPDSGFEDSDPVYVFVGGRQATTEAGVPVSVPFWMTLPSTTTSSIELNLVFPLPMTTIFPEPGVYNDHLQVSLESNVIPAIIYYTIDGTDPKTSSTRQQYTGPFVITDGVTLIRYYTEDQLGGDEEVKEAVYTILGPMVIPTPEAADYSTPLFVELSGNRAGTVYYRVNGAGSFMPFMGSIPIESEPDGIGETTIEAYLIDHRSDVGPTQTFVYKVDLVNPVISRFTLSNGDAVTASQIITVQVAAASYTNTVTGLLLSTFSDFRDAVIQLYQPEVTFLLPAPDGVKTVYAQVVDQLGQYAGGSFLMGAKTDTIELDTEIPTFTVSPSPTEPIGELNFTFMGTKSANSGIFLTLNAETEMLVVPYSAATTWEYTVTLQRGVNILVFQAGTAVGNRSGTTTRTVDARPIPGGVTRATTITKPDGTWRIPFVFLDERRGGSNVHTHLAERQHDFRLIVESDSGPDPIVLFPASDQVLTENVITVTGTAQPGSKITLRVEPRGKVQV